MAGDVPERSSLVVPYLMVGDPDEASAFYSAAFGFERAERIVGEDGVVLHIGMTYRGRGVLMMAPNGVNPVYGEAMRSPRASGVPPAILLYVYCADATALSARAQRAGAKLLSGPVDAFYGAREVKLEDPEGYVWAFRQHLFDYDPGQGFPPAA